MSYAIHLGDVLERLREMPSESIHCGVTSPPYWGLRDYGLPPSTWPDGWVGCLGLEPTPELFLAHMVSVFDEVRRVLRKDGTCWVNMGDSYNSGNSGCLGGSTLGGGQDNQAQSNRHGKPMVPGLKPKDLVGMPWMLAFALRSAGWWLRQVGLGPGVNADQINARYKALAQTAHPDKGGDADLFARITKARDAALREVTR